MSSQILPAWKLILRRNFTRVDRLADFLELSDEQRQKLASPSRFILNLPLRLAGKICKGTLEDPLFKQFVPTTEEAADAVGFRLDPVGDTLCRKEQKLIHKYQGRVLLTSTSACAMHCRYCFRQHFDYATTATGFEREIDLIAADPTIHEVILSGGDPLSLDDHTLETLLKKIAAIPHVKNVRFHTRFPIGIPERITPQFLSILQSIPVQFWMIVHVNHARELDDDIFRALKEVQKLGIPVLNQSVLLRGVNDSVEALAALSEALIAHGILPYYIHQLDRVKGAAHFEVEEKRGLELMNALALQMPGYALPRYVKEVAGMPSKVVVTSSPQS